MRINLTHLIISVFSISKVVIGAGFSNSNIHGEFAKRVEELANERAKSREHLPVHAKIDFGGLKPSVSNLAQEKWPVIEKFIQMPVDHNGSTDAMFGNRYWVYEKFYQAGGPIFLFDAGEWDISEYVEMYLTDEGSVFREFFETFGGMGIIWEHRYYGKSTPFVVNRFTTGKEFQFLTTEQGLADVAYFADRFASNTTEAIGQDLTPKGSPWIFVGVSYPGMRASFMRAKYPDTIFAAYSSSAPIEARVDMSGYYDQIYRGMVNALGTSCTKSITAAIKYIDGQLEASDETAAAVKRLFLGPNAELNPHGDFAEALASLFWNFQNSGVTGQTNLNVEGEDVTHSIFDMCLHIITDEAKIKAPPEGWEREKGRKWIAEHWAKYKPLAAAVGSKTGTSCGGYYVESTSNDWSCNLTFPFKNSDDIAWRWQYCTEWGFFPVANVGPNQLVSKFNDIEHQRKNCFDQFPTNLSSKYLPPLPTVDATNKKFGGWTAGSHQTRTFYTAGEIDPWTSLSYMSAESYAPHNNVTQTIPGCDEKTPSDQIFGYVLPDQVHIMDMVGGDVSQRTRELFKAALKKWLPCWKSAATKANIDLIGTNFTQKLQEPKPVGGDVDLALGGNNKTANGTVNRTIHADSHAKTNSTVVTITDAALRRRAQEWQA